MRVLCVGVIGVPSGLSPSGGIGSPQYGHTPDVVPESATIGIPQVGHAECCMSLLGLATALGLKHIVCPFLVLAGQARRSLLQKSDSSQLSDIYSIHYNMTASCLWSNSFEINGSFVVFWSLTADGRSVFIHCSRFLPNPLHIHLQ